VEQELHGVHQSRLCAWCIDQYDFCVGQFWFIDTRVQEVFFHESDILLIRNRKFKTESVSRFELNLTFQAAHVLQYLCDFLVFLVGFRAISEHTTFNVLHETTDVGNIETASNVRNYNVVPFVKQLSNRYRCQTTRLVLKVLALIISEILVFMLSILLGQQA
jgi:hypothetical protein